MKKKAFTLIELLAVIIVLAVIALIATPIVLDVVEDTKKSADLSSANMVLSAAKNYYAESLLDDSKKAKMDGTVNIFDELSMENKPSTGEVYINEQGQVAILVVIRDTAYVKQFGTNTFETKPKDEDIFVGVDENVPTVDIQINTTTPDIVVDTWYTESPTITIAPKDEEIGVNYYEYCQGIDCTPNTVGTGETITITDSKETQICVIVYDKAGNASEKKCTDTIMVDTIGPEISGIADITVAVNGIVDLDTGVSVTDATSGVNGTYTYVIYKGTDVFESIDTSKTGTYDVVYTAYDNAGNKAEVTRKVIISASAPTITYSVADGIINENGWAKSNFFVTINVIDNTGQGLKEFKVCTSSTDTCDLTNGSVITDSTTATRDILVESANNRICVQATDNDNQTSEIICSDAYKLDKTAPVAGTINITGTKGENEWYTTDVTITTNEGSDTLSGHLSTVSNITSITENTEGTKVIVTTTDKAGNTSTNEYTIKLDKTVPTATIERTTSNNKNVLTGTINPSTTESNYTYQWYKDGSKITNATSISYTTSESGTYKLEVTTGSGKVINSNEITINSYAVSYNLNGGTGSITSTTKIEDLSTNITTSIPTRTGYEFMGWGTTSTSKTKTYSSNDAYTANENEELYAIWKKTLTATFVANGAELTGQTSPTCDIYNAEESCSVTAPTISRSGFSIVGFGTTADATTSAVDSGKTATISADTNYYAVTSKEVTVTFYRNGAASITPINGSASTSSSITQKCTIWNTATTCSITSPSIAASSNTPSIIGWDSTSSYTSNEWSVNTAKDFSGNASYYAVTMKSAVTHTITYTKDTGVYSIGATSGSCNIAATYNGTAQSESCSVTLPSITASTGYTAAGWYNSSGTKLGNAEASISVSATQTLTAKTTINSYPCSAGYYLGANTTSCTKCEAGSYCPGGTYTYSSSTQGKTTCPSGYGSSVAGSDAASDCYKTITVTYSGNGSTSGSTASQSCNAYYNNESCSITLNSNGFAKTNYTFQGWGTSTSSVSHNAGTSYNFSSNTTLNAIWKTVICRRATTLHTETCSQTSSHCYDAGYYSSGSKGTSTITYGSLGTSGTLNSGDAFDCDVNGDGTFDPATERFYYVSDLYNTTSKSFDSNYAVLVYYNNTYQGVANNTSSSKVAYDSSNKNYQGPVTGIANLPTTTQWSNISLSNTSRAIITQKGTTSTSGGTLPTAFSYSGYAARLLTAQEINKACGITSGSYTTGELDSCNYLMENTKYSSSSMGIYGYWLETPYASSSNYVWNVFGYGRNVNSYSADYTGDRGVRPAIEILKSDISY